MIVLARGWQAFGLTYREAVLGIISFGLLVIVVFVWAYESVLAREEDDDKADLLEALRERDARVVLIQPRWGAA